MSRRILQGTPLTQHVSISRSLVCKEALRLPNQALAQGRLLLLRPRQVCWALQEPHRVLLRRPEQAMAQGSAQQLQSFAWLRWTPRHRLLQLVLVALVHWDEAGCGGPS